MDVIVKISLYYAEGRSAKEYHAEIIAVAGGNVVNFRYGRRGGTLTSGTKTASPVDFTEAKRIFDKLVRDKTAKGCTSDASGMPYQHIVSDVSCDFVPQLLNPVSVQGAINLINDPL